MGKTLLEWLNESKGSGITITKKEFGRIMHDPSATEDEIADALRQLEEAEGYENLGDD